MKTKKVFSMPKLTHLNKEKPSVLHPTHKRRRLQKYLALLAIFVLMILTSLYFISPYSDVETLSVEGSNEVFDQQVIDSSGIRSGDSLWQTYFNRQEIEEQIITAIPQVSDVNLSFSGLNDFTFEIEEYATVAYILEDNRYTKVLENGYVLEDEQVVSLGNHPVFIGFDEGDALSRMIEEFNQVEESVQNLVSEVEHVESERNPLLVKAYMNNGNQVLASIPSFSDRMNVYPHMVQAVGADTHGFFDLEAGAFFIPFVNNDPEEAELDQDEEVEIDSTSE